MTIADDLDRRRLLSRAAAGVGLLGPSLLGLGGCATTIGAPAAPACGARGGGARPSSSTPPRRSLGLRGPPMEWRAKYVGNDGRPPPDPPPATRPRLQFADSLDRLSDITPRRERLPVGATP